MVDDRIVIVGGGIAGLSLALHLHQRGIACHVYEAAPAFRPLGVGISLLPHGTKALVELGLLDELRKRAVIFQESCFVTGKGQFVYTDPAVSEYPQFLIHRADLHEVLYDAVVQRLGADAVTLGHTSTGVEEAADGAVVHFVDSQTREPLPSQSGRAVIACDGIHSSIRAQFYPDEGEPVFTGVNMWRGTTIHPPIASGGSHLRIGTVDRGKMVIYPIRNLPDGNQLVNWVAEIRQEESGPVDWSVAGRVEDVLPTFADWTFDWLDVPALIKNAEAILEYPMSDRNPVDRWTFGHVTLVGDAAHAMIPRGSNGAMQAILDTVVLAEAIAEEPYVAQALVRYELTRRDVVNALVLKNRVTPPDHLIEVVETRTGYQRFERVEDVITTEEIRAILDSYKSAAGYNKATLAQASRSA
ncbi:flavin-dependent oxidoreductase [Mycobacterium sp. 4D054]|uniref:flavin-dependent oxidoreductase n=1 Tax=unclassified Mycobacterium TaxID=2642494 RepID=UPI0021B32DC0|nr:flavin-dependent oxidoreductase [Mycobacterium sp. SMC-8]UXA12215.1 flavin-dependent oxidoreductase [Mycobacterium sp. SMC-8]